MTKPERDICSTNWLKEVMNNPGRKENTTTLKHRVLVLNHFAVPPTGSGGTRHFEMFAALDKFDFEILAASHAGPGRGKRVKYPSFIFVFSSPYKRNDFFRILNWITYSVSAGVVGLLRPRIDVVYASSPHLLAGLTGLMIARIERIPFVLEIRDLWPKILIEMGGFREKSLVYRALLYVETMLYRQANTIVVMAPGSAAHIRGTGVDNEKIIYIPNGADPTCEDDLPSRAALRESYGFHRRTAVYTGAHGPANGLDELVRAAARVGDVGIDLVLVGEGVEKKSLERLSDELRLTNVRFLPPLPKSEIPSLLFAADIGVHVLRDVPLFRHAISPNKVFDYLASGLPIISNSPGIVSDIIGTAEAGWVTEPDRLEDGLHAAASASNEELVEIGSRGKRWIQENQSRAAMARRLENVLDRLMSPTRLG